MTFHIFSVRLIPFVVYVLVYSFSWMYTIPPSKYIMFSYGAKHILCFQFGATIKDTAKKIHVRCLLVYIRIHITWV